MLTCSKLTLINVSKLTFLRRHALKIPNGATKWDRRSTKYSKTFSVEFIGVLLLFNLNNPT